MLNTKNLAIAAGLASGIFVGILTLLAIIGVETPLISLMVTGFIGYTVSVGGIVIGFLHGLILGFVFFYILGYLYTVLETKT